MKIDKKNKYNSLKNQQGKKDFNSLNEQEKKNHNKPLDSGNHVQQKWFPNERK